MGGDDHPHLQKLTEEEAKEIRQMLLNSNLSQKEIADEY